MPTPQEFHDYDLYLIRTKSAVSFTIILCCVFLQVMNYELSRMNAMKSPIIPVIGELIKNSPGTISLLSRCGLLSTSSNGYGTITKVPC